MSTELTEAKSHNVPAWMKEISGKVKFGNLDPSDLKPPRLKILAGQSPEVMDGVPGAAPGHFWMTILNKDLGTAVTGSPITLKKTYQVWHPRVAGSANMGPLAIASNGTHWDIPNQTFVVRFGPNEGGGEETWKIGKTILEDGTSDFGTSRPDNPRSRPIAQKTFDILWLIDMPDGRKQICVFTNKSTGIKPTETFLSTAAEVGADQFYQKWRIIAKKASNRVTGDAYFTYDYQYIDVLQSREECAVNRALFDKFSKSGFVTDMTEEGSEIAEAKRATRESGYNAREVREADDDIPF